MSEFGDESLEQKILDWVKLEAKEMSANKLEIIHALAKILAYITEDVLQSSNMEFNT